jgi:hypothetical protein
MVLSQADCGRAAMFGWPECRTRSSSPLELEVGPSSNSDLANRG